MSEERGFEVTDRRHHAQAAAPAVDGETDAVSDRAEAEGDEEGFGVEDDAYSDAGFQNPLAGMTVAGILRMAVGLLNERAWAGMGLVPDPLTGKIEKNLPEAKRAIDAIGDLAKHVEADATAEDRRELQVMLTNLRVNFVRQSS